MLAHTLTVTSFDRLPTRLRNSTLELARRAGLSEYEFPAVTTCFEWAGGHAYSAVVGRGGRGVTAILTRGSAAVIFGHGGLQAVARTNEIELPDWAPIDGETEAA